MPPGFETGSLTVPGSHLLRLYWVVRESGGSLVPILLALGLQIMYTLSVFVHGAGDQNSGQPAGAASTRPASTNVGFIHKDSDNSWQKTSREVSDNLWFE